MKRSIVYIELKTGFNDDGPAWIGKAEWSRSGRTLYFNGKAFRRSIGGGVKGNHFDVETGEEYWISGVKKDQQDRHWTGSGPVMIDEAVINDYLALIGANRLDPTRFKVVQLDHSDVTSRIHELQNKPLD